MTPLDADAVVGAMRRDKKGRDGRLPFVLAPAIGTFRIVQDVTDDLVRAALRDIEITESHLETPD
jgi:3-dehydroquinate synthetase